MDRFFGSSHRSCSVKKMFLKILQISQENTCVRAFLIMLFIKKGLQHRRFPVKFVKILRTPILKNISGDCFYLLNLFIWSSEILLSFAFASFFSPFLLVFSKRGLLVGSLAKHIELTSWFSLQVCLQSCAAMRNFSFSQNSSPQVLMQN